MDVQIGKNCQNPQNLTSGIFLPHLPLLRGVLRDILISSLVRKSAVSTSSHMDLAAHPALGRRIDARDVKGGVLTMTLLVPIYRAGRTLLWGVIGWGSKGTFTMT